MTARLAAARVLVALERGRTTLSREIEEDRADLEDPRDRGAAAEIVAGVLRWQAALDACLRLAATGLSTDSRRKCVQFSGQVRINCSISIACRRTRSCMSQSKSCGS
jgi:hypothetical protein